MFGIGMPELMVIFVIALIVIGPQKLPELARSLGKTLAEFKRATDDFKWKIEEESRAQEERERVAKEVAAKEAALNAAKAAEAAQAAGGEPTPEPAAESAAEHQATANATHGPAAWQKETRETAPAEPADKAADGASSTTEAPKADLKA